MLCSDSIAGRKHFSNLSFCVTFYDMFNPIWRCYACHLISHYYYHDIISTMHIHLDGSGQDGTHVHT